MTCTAGVFSVLIALDGAACGRAEDDGGVDMSGGGMLMPAFGLTKEHEVAAELVGCALALEGRLVVLMGLGAPMLLVLENGQICGSKVVAMAAWSAARPGAGCCICFCISR